MIFQNLDNLWTVLRLCEGSVVQVETTKLLWKQVGQGKGSHLWVYKRKRCQNCGFEDTMQNGQACWSGLMQLLKQLTMSLTLRSCDLGAAAWLGDVCQSSYQQVETRQVHLQRRFVLLDLKFSEIDTCQGTKLYWVENGKNCKRIVLSLLQRGLQVWKPFLEMFILFFI